MIRALAASALRAAARLRRVERAAFVDRNFELMPAGVLTPRARTFPLAASRGRRVEIRLPLLAAVPQAALAVEDIRVTGAARIGLSGSPRAEARLAAAPAPSSRRATDRGALCRVALHFRRCDIPEAVARIGDRWSREVIGPSRPGPRR